MTPTDDDSGIPDDDELVAQIVPLRRRQDDSDNGEQPHDEPQAAAEHTDDWSVFDPPEDLQPVERAHQEQHSEPDPDHAPPDQYLEHPWTSTPRTRNRLIAFAGVAVAMLAIAALAVLTLKGHAGASPHRAAAPTPTAGLTSASRALTVHQGGTPAPRPGRPAARSSHHRPAQRRPPTRRLPHTATAGTPTGGQVSAGRGPVETTPQQTQSKPSSSNAPATQGAGSEFGIER